MLKLDIGAGDLATREAGNSLACQLPLEDWIHIDIQPGKHIEVVTDFGDLPYDDGTVDEIFVGDVIEHIPRWRTAEVLGEWNRVLKVGGKFSGRTPNLDRAMRDYAEGKITLDDALSAIYAGGKDEYHVHYISYTPTSLVQILERYGFGQVDLSQSPGPEERPWWLVFSCMKTRNI
jgi:predicted SAM-dependent methyltransferase